MKSVFLIVMIGFLPVVLFAETSATSTVTTISTNPSKVPGNTNTTIQSTTYSTSSPQSTPGDDAIVSRIYTKYAKAPALIGTTLKVSSQNGIVTINGTVTAQAQADEAYNIAKSTPGVKDVRSNIDVTTNPDLNKNPASKVPNY